MIEKLYTKSPLQDIETKQAQKSTTEDFPVLEDHEPVQSSHRPVKVYQEHLLEDLLVSKFIFLLLKTILTLFLYFHNNGFSQFSLFVFYI